jgi:hypothetical protein
VVPEEPDMEAPEHMEDAVVAGEEKLLGEVRRDIYN